MPMRWRREEDEILRACVEEYSEFLCWPDEHYLGQGKYQRPCLNVKLMLAAGSATRPFNRLEPRRREATPPNKQGLP